VPLSFEIATHIYLAILTDLDRSITRTIIAAAPSTSAGNRSRRVSTAAMARRVFDSNSFGKPS
jgi:hypothetical protein